MVEIPTLLHHGGYWSDDKIDFEVEGMLIKLNWNFNDFQFEIAKYLLYDYN